MIRAPEIDKPELERLAFLACTVRKSAGRIAIHAEYLLREIERYQSLTRPLPKERTAEEIRYRAEQIRRLWPE